MNNESEQSIDRVQGELKAIETNLADTGNPLTAAWEQKAESLQGGWKNALAKRDAEREVQKPMKGKRAVDEAAADATRIGSTGPLGKSPEPLNLALAA